MPSAGLAGVVLPYCHWHGIATLARHYAGVLQELEHSTRVPAEEAIRAARAAMSTVTIMNRVTATAIGRG